MLRPYSIFILIIFLNISISSALNYTIDVKRYSSFPLISKTLGAKKDFYLSAALYTDENGNICAISAGANFGDSVISFYYSTVIFKNGIPVATQPGNTPVFNTSDDMSTPSITKYNELFYVLFTDNSINSRMRMVMVSDPKDPYGWKYNGNITLTSDIDLVFSGTPLFATTENGFKQNYLFWSDQNTQFVGCATAPLQDVTIWTNVDVILQTINPNLNLIQPGNPPLQLKTGDFLHIFNGCYSSYQWSLGYAILDKTDPCQIKQLSSEAILSPKLDWEIGNSSSFYEKNLFLTGLLHDKINCPEENDWTQCFFGLYSGSFTHIGAIKIIVSWH